MNIAILNLIYFSPTGTTRKIVKGIGEAFAIRSVNEYNVTKPSKIDYKIDSSKNSLTIIGAPVYGGHLPAEAVNRLGKFQSDKTPAAIVVVYGNRKYENSLMELKNLATECGFKVIAAGVFIGEHSFSTKEKPIAKDRPDKRDLVKAREFNQLIKDKIKDSISIDSFKELEVPGNYPLKERMPPHRPSSPDTIEADCNRCKICEDVCPVNAITVNEKVVTDKEFCIHCCACIKFCPQNARIFNNPMINTIKERLFIDCQQRKEPEFFV